MNNRYSIGAQYEGDVFTPSTVLAEMRTVDNAIMATVRAMGRFEVPENVRKEYLAFAKEWKKFYQENQSLFKRSLNVTYGTVQEFRKRVDSWRRRLESYNLPMVTPALPKPVKRRAWYVPVIAASLGGLFVAWLFKK